MVICKHFSFSLLNDRYIAEGNHHKEQISFNPPTEKPPTPWRFFGITVPPVSKGDIALRQSPAGVRHVNYL